MAVPTVFETCQPRADVLAGAIRDDEFMADLSSVVNGTAPQDYLDPAAFFAKTYPTRGIKELLKAVCLRISGRGGEVSSIIRLGTQYGGGKTHALISLVHAVRGMKDVANPERFVDAAILPTGPVRVAALDGENADPANGLLLEPGLYARSLWGEMAYRLAGRDGYERVRSSDEKHIAPGAATLAELFGASPRSSCLMKFPSIYARWSAPSRTRRNNSLRSSTIFSRPSHPTPASLWFTRWPLEKKTRRGMRIKKKTSAPPQPWPKRKASPSAPPRY